VRLVAPVLAGRLRAQSALCAATVAFSTAGFLGLLAAPVGGGAVWAVLLGIGQGASIATAMTIIVLRSPDPATTGRLSGLAQGFGYLLAAVGPLLVGAVHDATGSWTAPLWLLVALTGPGLVAGVAAGRPRHVRT
jgi:MFS transporter, CP family, cyanate transporter